MSWTFTKKRRNIDSVDVPRLSLAKLRGKQFKTTVPSIVGEYTKVLMTEPVVGRLTARNRKHDVKIKRKKHIGARLYPSLAFDGETKIIVTPSYTHRRNLKNAFKSISMSHLTRNKRSTMSSRINSPSLSPSTSMSNYRGRFGNLKGRRSRGPSRIGTPERKHRSRRSSRFSTSSSRPHSRPYSPISRPHSRQYSGSRPQSSQRRRRRRRKKKVKTYTKIPPKSNVLVIQPKEEEVKNIEEDFQDRMYHKRIPIRPTELVPRRKEAMSRILSTKPLERLPFTEQSPFVIRDNVIQQLKNHIDSPNLWARGLLTNHLESGFYEPIVLKEDFSKVQENGSSEEEEKERKGKIPKRDSDLTFGFIHTKLKRPKTVPIRLHGEQSRLNFRKRKKWREDDDNDDDDDVSAIPPLGSFNDGSEVLLPRFQSSHRLLRDGVKIKKIESPEEKRQKRRHNWRLEGEDLEIGVSQTLSDRDLELEVSRIFAGNLALRESGGGKRPSTVPYGRNRVNMKRNNPDPNFYLEQLKKEFDLMDV